MTVTRAPGGGQLIDDGRKIAAVMVDARRQPAAEQVWRALTLLPRRTIAFFPPLSLPPSASAVASPPLGSCARPVVARYLPR